MNPSARVSREPARSRWWPLVAICLGTFILLVDVTIVSVALPPMARDLHSQLDSLQWVVDAYALALAALLLVCGSLADRFGRRRLFQLGLALFALSSLACALAPNAGFLIAARTVQGAGAAALAQGAGLEMSSHLFPEVSVHLLGATPTCHWLEYVDWADAILEEPLAVKDGFASPPERPGVGGDSD